MGFKKLAKDNEGNTYVAERSVDGDAVLKVKTFETARRGDVVYWPTATYEVSVPTADPPLGPFEIIRLGSGVYDVPEKAQRVGMLDAVRIALGRMQPPPPREWRGRAPQPRSGRSAGRDQGGLAGSSLRNSRPGPAVIAEPQENWTLKQGDRIMRHLALYGAEGVDAQTLSAGMHELATTAIRKHLRALAKNSGPVVIVRTGIYARRSEQS